MESTKAKCVTYECDDSTARKVVATLSLVAALGLAFLTWNLSRARESVYEAAVLERKTAETAAQIAMEKEAEARFQLKLITETRDSLTRILDSNEHAVIVVNKTHRIVEWNEGAERLFLWKREEILGKDLMTLIPPDLCPIHNKGFDEAMIAPIFHKTLVIRCIAKDAQDNDVPCRITVRFFSVDNQPLASAIIDRESDVKYVDARPKDKDENKPITRSTDIASN